MGHLRLVYSAPKQRASDDRVDSFDKELGYLFQTLRWLAPPASDVDRLADGVFLALESTSPLDTVSTPLRLQLFGAVYRMLRNDKRRRRAAEAPLRSPSLHLYCGRQWQAANSNARVALVQASLERIPLPRRAVLVLHDIDGTPLEDVAKTLSVSRAVTRWRLRRARRDLGRAVRHLGGVTALDRQVSELLAVGRIAPVVSAETRGRLLAPARAALAAEAVFARAGARQRSRRASALVLAAWVVFVLAATTAVAFRRLVDTHDIGRARATALENLTQKGE